MLCAIDEISYTFTLYYTIMLIQDWNERALNDLYHTTTEFRVEYYLNINN